MKFKSPELVQYFKDFISSVSRKDRVAVIHHTDPDGVCSGVIMAKLIQKVRNKRIDLRLNQKGNIHYLTDRTLSELKKNKINKVIVTDLSADENPKSLQRLAGFADVLIIDHHPVYNIVDKPNVIMVKSSLVSDIEPPRYCAAKLCYDLANTFIDMSDFDWIAVVGMIGDLATAPFRKWMVSVFKKYRVQLKEDLYKTKLGMVAVLISSAESFDSDNVGLCFDVVYSARSFNDVLDSRLRRFYDRVNREIDYHLRNLEHLADFYLSLDLIFYEISPKYNIKSPLCTLLGIRYPNKTILVVHSHDNIVAVSARRGDSNVAVNQLLQRAVKGIPGASAGGHVPSAGAVIPGKYYKKFKKKVINLLEKR